MFRTVFLATAASAALLACATDADMEGDATTAAMSADMTPEDRMNYVKMAAASDLYEIQSSQLALTKATKAEVRTMAQMLIRDHTNSSERLMAAARAAGMTPMTPMLMPMQERMMAELRNAGASFDRVYMAQQVRAHQMALALHSNYARDGDTPALQATAAAMTPIIQMHLEGAKRMD